MRELSVNLQWFPPSSVQKFRRRSPSSCIACKVRKASFTAGEESGLGDWQFRGKRIAAAVIEDLFEQHGLANATHVLLTGDSAGGVGAMNNADWIGSMLKYAHYIPLRNRSSQMPYALRHCSVTPQYIFK